MASYENRTIRSCLFFIFLTISFCSCFTNNHNEDVHDQLRQRNAIWSESIYFRGIRPSTGYPLSDSLIAAYSKTLKYNNIKYAYLFAGPYGADGCIPDYAFSKTAIRSVQVLKRLNPDLVVLPWIGGVQNSTVHLNDSGWVENALSDTKRLVEVLGVEGVHIDLEYILPGNPYLDATVDEEQPRGRQVYGANVNRFHAKLRTMLPGKFISSVVACSSPKAKQWKRKTSVAELRELVKNIDQLSFLFYDTSIDDQNDFKGACRDQLSIIRELKRDTNNRIEYLMAVGTFVNRRELSEYRNLEIENLSNTLTTIKETLVEDPPDLPLVDGIAIFCDWETDSSEWREIRENWTNQ